MKKKVEVGGGEGKGCGVGIGQQTIYNVCVCVQPWWTGSGWAPDPSGPTGQPGNHQPAETMVSLPPPQFFVRGKALILGWVNMYQMFDFFYRFHNLSSSFTSFCPETSNFSHILAKFVGGNWFMCDFFCTAMWQSYKGLISFLKHKFTVLLNNVLFLNYCTSIAHFFVNVPKMLKDKQKYQRLEIKSALSN